MRRALLFLFLASCGAEPASEIALGLERLPSRCPATLFDNAVPRTISSDTDAVEVGVKLRTRGTMSILGVRFYKGANNTGTHVGTLWTAAGAPVASATFAGETAVGWQEVRFAAPVLVPPDTTYVASVSMPRGGFAADLFTLGSRVGDMWAPVYSLASGETGGNGVYVYGRGFPWRTFSDANYYVDVIADDLTAPEAAQGLTAQEVSGSRVVLTWSAPPLDRQGSVSAPILAQYVFRDGVQLAEVSASANSFTDGMVQAGVRYHYAVRATDWCANLGTPAELDVTTPAAPPPPSGETLFGDAVPASYTTSNDISAVEVGVRFRATADGEIAGVRFLRSVEAAAGTTVSLWNDQGVRLGSAQWAGGTVPGWQEVAFTTPIAVTANQYYVASYHSPNGRFTWSPSLPSPAAGNLRYEGSRYYYSPTPRFPSLTYAFAGYWVDVRYRVAQTPPPATASIFGDTPPPALEAANASPVVVGVRFSSDVATAVRAIRFYRATRAAPVRASLFSAGGALLASSPITASAPGWNDVAVDPPVVIAANTTYVASIALGASDFVYTRGGLAAEIHTGTLRAFQRGGVYIYSASPTAFPQQTFLDSNYWIDVSVSTSAPPPPSTETLFGAGQPAGIATNVSGSPVVVGVKLLSDVAGEIRAIRYFREVAGAPGCCGVALWTIGGTLLASAPGPGGSTPGWREVALSPPVAIQPEQLYVASYFASDGAFTYQIGGLAAGWSSGDLTAPPDDEAGGNGVYAYAPSHVFPARRFSRTNYFVDVVFAPAGP